ncbi:hypothetical protein ACIA8G_41475 [Lentzea sp. NPDC051213]|uniref:hypothetical protein n=1 Tax=Lentzea sp. NPDC051213 TaxID=3364126 RepID=UPI00379630B1
MLRLLIVVAFLIACSLVYDALPALEGSLVLFVMFAGVPALMRWWAGRDPVEQKPAHDGSPESRRVWRVRWWVRLVAVVVPLAGLPFVFQPGWLNPDWNAGVPLGDLIVVALVYAALGLAAWAAFRSRLDLDEQWVRVINPWGVRSVPHSSVRSVRQGSYGVELVLDDGSVIAAFAVQCVGSPAADPPPRWVEVARAVTGKDPA